MAKAEDDLQGYIDGDRNYKPKNYSTEEQEIGINWIDGKKIYQRVFHLEPNSIKIETEYNPGITIQNIDTLIESKVITTGNNGNNKEANWIGARYDAEENNIILFTLGPSGYGGITKIDIVLQYTKTN